MSKVFLPACKVKNRFQNPSEKLRTYLEEKEQVKTIGCCKAFCGRLSKEDTAVVVCNNCAAILEESSQVGNIRFVWEIIDRDDHFPFPDYHGERMTIQDCWRAYEKRNVQDAVRSLLRKMNIEAVELEKNFAPRRYAADGAGMYRALSPKEQQLFLEDHCKGIDTKRTVCYCLSCLDGIQQGGKQAVHLLELLFLEENLPKGSEIYEKKRP